MCLRVPLPCGGPGGRTSAEGRPETSCLSPPPLPSPRRLPGSVPPCSSWQLGQGAGWGGAICLLLAAGSRAPACALPARVGGRPAACRPWPRPPAHALAPRPRRAPEMAAPPPLPVVPSGDFFPAPSWFLWFFSLSLLGCWWVRTPSRVGAAPWDSGCERPRPGHAAPLRSRMILAQLGVISVTSVFFKLQYNGHIPSVASGFLK